jgi:hypothetical protein
MGDHRNARAVLTGAERIVLPPEASDVRALFCRAFARELLETPADPVRAEAFAREAAAPLPDPSAFDPRTGVESVEACVLYGRARLLQRDIAGARDGLAKGRAFRTFDQRELDALEAEIARVTTPAKPPRK